MTTKPTPASQPYPEFCTGCWKRVEECKCASEQPSPARSDKDADPRMESLAAANAVLEESRANRLERAQRLGLAERAPSGDTIEKMSMSQVGVGEQSIGFVNGWNACVAEIARRATAGTEDDIESICDAYESGVGHGLQRDGHKSGAMFSNPACGKAYELGYTEGESRATAGNTAPTGDGHE